MKIVKNLLLQLLFYVSCTTCTSPDVYMYRILNKNGLHRTLFTKLLFPQTSIDINCYCLIQESLPPGLYVDPYEMKNLESYGGPQFMSPSVDIEKPAEISPAINITIYSSALVPDGDMFVSNVTIPIHIRYHQPSDSTETAAILLHNPTLYINCPKKGLTDNPGDTELPCYGKKDELCKWTKMSCKTDSDMIRLDVPVGNLHHQSLVVFGTLASTIGACIFIIVRLKQFHIKDE